MAKLTYLVAIIGGHVTGGYHSFSDLSPNKIPYGQRHYQCLGPYGIVFCLKYRKINLVKTGLFFQEIIFIMEFPGSNFLLPTFLTGGKWDFQVEICYLLLLISNPDVEFL